MLLLKSHLGLSYVKLSSDTGLDSLQAPDRTVSFIDGTFKCSPIHFKQKEPNLLSYYESTRLTGNYDPVNCLKLVGV